MDAAPCVFAPLVGSVGCVERLFVKAPAGRQRVNVLAALNASTHAIFTVQHLTYVTAATVGELLRLLAGTQPGIPMTVMLDNARYQRCALGQAVAQALDME